MKHNKETLHKKLMLWGKKCGCHQMKERSFFICEKQFPVCARCTGVLVGNLTAYIVFFIYIFSINTYVIGCAVLFLDWIIQELGIKESTNTRRFMTGIIGGFSLTSLQCIIIRQIVGLIIKLF